MPARQRVGAPVLAGVRAAGVVPRFRLVAAAALEQVLGVLPEGVVPAREAACPVDTNARTPRPMPACPLIGRAWPRSLGASLDLQTDRQTQTDRQRTARPKLLTTILVVWRTDTHLPVTKRRPYTHPSSREPLPYTLPPTLAALPLPPSPSHTRTPLPPPFRAASLSDSLGDHVRTAIAPRDPKVIVEV